MMVVGSRIVPCFGLVLAACTGAFGQSETSTTTVTAGYKFDMLSRSSNESYYKVELLGRRLFDQGSPFSFIRHDAIMPPFQFGRNPGDNKWNIRFENGTVRGKGGIFDSGLLSPLKLAGLRDVMGAAYLAGADNFKDLTFSIGLALPGTFLKPAQARSLANTFLLSVAAERRENSDTDKDENLGVLAGKARLALALAWSQSEEAVAPIAKLFDEIQTNTGSRAKARKHVQDKIIKHVKDGLKALAQPQDKYDAKDDEALRKLSDLDSSPDVNSKQGLDRWIMIAATIAEAAAQAETDPSKKKLLDHEAEYLDMLNNAWGEAERVGDDDEEGWIALVKRISGIVERVKSYFPILTVFAEGSAWMPITRSSTFANKPLGLLTTGINYYPAAGRNDLYFRFALELGYERASPGVRKSNLLFATAFRF